MNKKIIISIIAVCSFITLGTIYYFNTNEADQYCNYQLDWDKCNGKIIKISGANPATGDGGIMQHPLLVSGNDSKQFQSYLDTSTGDQIILLSNEKINCPDKITVVGTLQTNVGPCDTNSSGKAMYCGSSITVQQWKCNKP